MSWKLPQGDIPQAQKVIRITFFTIASLRLEKIAKLQKYSKRLYRGHVYKDL